MFSTENPTNVTEVPIAEATEHWEFTKAETVGINLGSAPQRKSLRLSRITYPEPVSLVQMKLARLKILE